MLRLDFFSPPPIGQLPDDLLLDALVRLGDGQVEKMTETRLLAPYVTSVFDPPSGDVAVPASWSRATARALLSVIHHGGLNFDRLYPRLYQLLDDDLLACPFAERFFIDLDTYLSSLWAPFLAWRFRLGPHSRHHWGFQSNAPALGGGSVIWNAGSPEQCKVFVL